MIHAGRWCAYSAIAASFFPVAYGQTDVPNKLQVVQDARKLYYIPAASGLQSFSCGVTMDWLAIYRNATPGGNVTADDPRVQYLNKIRISFTATIDGKSNVDWVPPAGDYPGSKDALDQMHGGVVQVLNGFAQTWSTFLTGSFLPTQEDLFHLVRTANGYELTVEQGTTKVDEKWDPDYTLNEYHVSMPNTDLDAHTTFEKSSAGLLFTGYDSIITAAATDSKPLHLLIEAAYEPVGGYQIPKNLYVDVQGSGKFNFNFVNCKVNQN